MPPRLPSVPPRPVLVVEDDEDGREMVCEILGLIGLVTRGAASVEEALAVLAEPPPPALILLDWWLPTAEGGRRILRALAQDPALAAVPVVVVSGAAEARDLEGVAGTLEKPFRSEELYGAILPLLAGKAHKYPPGSRRRRQPRTPAVVTPYAPRPRKPAATVDGKPGAPADALARRIEALHRDTAAAWTAATATCAASVTLLAQSAELRVQAAAARAQAAATRAAARAIRRG